MLLLVTTLTISISNARIILDRGHGIMSLRAILSLFGEEISMFMYDKFVFQRIKVLNKFKSSCRKGRKVNEFVWVGFNYYVLVERRKEILNTSQREVYSRDVVYLLQ